MNVLLFLNALLILAFVVLYLYLVYLASQAAYDWIGAWWRCRRQPPPLSLRQRIDRKIEEIEDEAKSQRERLVYEVIVAARHVPHTPGLTATSKRLDGTLTFPKGKVS